MKLTFKNSFHSTSVNINAPGLKVSEAQSQKIRRVLCGMPDCSCCIYDSIVDQDGYALDVVDETMGGNFILEYREVRK